MILLVQGFYTYLQQRWFICVKAIFSAILLSREPLRAVYHAQCTRVLPPISTEQHGHLMHLIRVGSWVGHGCRALITLGSRVFSICQDKPEITHQIFFVNHHAPEISEIHPNMWCWMSKILVFNGAVFPPHSPPHTLPLGCMCMGLLLPGLLGHDDRPKAIGMLLTQMP